MENLFILIFELAKGKKNFYTRKCDFCSGEPFVLRYFKKNNSKLELYRQEDCIVVYEQKYEANYNQWNMTVCATHYSDKPITVQSVKTNPISELKQILAYYGIVLL